MYTCTCMCMRMCKHMHLPVFTHVWESVCVSAYTSKCVWVYEEVWLEKMFVQICLCVFLSYNHRFLSIVKSGLLAYLIPFSFNQTATINWALCRGMWESQDEVLELGVVAHQEYERWRQEDQQDQLESQSGSGIAWATWDYLKTKIKVNNKTPHSNETQQKDVFLGLERQLSDWEPDCSSRRPCSVPSTHMVVHSDSPDPGDLCSLLASASTIHTRCIYTQAGLIHIKERSFNQEVAFEKEVAGRMPVHL